jgi:hypothetical protein
MCIWLTVGLGSRLGSLLRAERASIRCTQRRPAQLIDAREENCTAGAPDSVLSGAAMCRSPACDSSGAFYWLAV